MEGPKTHTVLSAQDLIVGYRSGKQAIPVAAPISFTAQKSRLIALVGPNGVGKSTLLRTLCQLQPALEGHIEIQGQKLSELSPLLLATHISVVLTEAPASANLTVEELVSLGRQPYTNWMGNLTTEDRDIITEVLEQTDTLTLKARKCYELSDGQMQRVAIARALAQDTPVIIMDEPTTHLDVYHRAYILRLLKNLTAETGKTILFSTHEIDLALQLSDQMLLMTASGNYFDTPQALIAAGRFTSLFPEDTVHFDPKLGRFTIKK